MPLARAVLAPVPSSPCAPEPPGALPVPRRPQAPCVPVLGGLFAESVRPDRRSEPGPIDLADSSPLARPRRSGETPVGLKSLAKMAQPLSGSKALKEQRRTDRVLPFRKARDHGKPECGLSSVLQLKLPPPAEVPPIDLSQVPCTSARQKLGVRATLLLEPEALQLIEALWGEVQADTDPFGRRDQHFQHVVHLEKVSLKLLLSSFTLLLLHHSLKFSGQRGP